MELRLTKDRVFVQEIGFIPTGIEDAGLHTSWDFHKDLRVHQPMRIGIVKYIGVQCQEVEIGKTVVYNVRHTNNVLGPEGEEYRQIREIDLQGYWED
jgi:hypothetical protein